jgi:hypothetical protein
MMLIIEGWEMGKVGKLLPVFLICQNRTNTITGQGIQVGASAGR